MLSCVIGVVLFSVIVVSVSVSICFDMLCGFGVVVGEIVDVVIGVVQLILELEIQVIIVFVLFMMLLMMIGCDQLCFYCFLLYEWWENFLVYMIGYFYNCYYGQD